MVIYVDMISYYFKHGGLWKRFGFSLSCLIYAYIFFETGFVTLHVL